MGIEILGEGSEGRWMIIAKVNWKDDKPAKECLVAQLEEYEDV